MKSHFCCLLTLAVTLSAVSCSKVRLNEQRTDPGQDPFTEEERVEVTLEALTDAGATKTMRGEDGRVYWKPADEIKVFCGQDSAKFTSTNSVDTVKASFSGTMSLSTVMGLSDDADDDTKIWAVYPYDSRATYANGKIKTPFYPEPIGTPGTFNDDQYISVARSNSFSLRFYNVLSGFKFTLDRPGIKKITFRGNNDEILKGALTISFDSDGKPQTEFTGWGMLPFMTITLTPEGDTFETGVWYYIPLVPATFEKGFRMTFEKEGSTGTFVYDKSVTFARNTFVSKSSVDAGATFEGSLVDLGLSVKWFSCNLGAGTPEEQGAFYQWAGTEDVSEKTITDECPYGKATDYILHVSKYIPEGLTDYCLDGYEPDGKLTLEACDDAASLASDGAYCIPTSAMWQELIDNCDAQWTDNYEGTGVSGTIMTSKVSGYTDKSIFLPAYGNRYDSYNWFTSRAFYWSSTLDSEAPDKALWAMAEKDDGIRVSSGSRIQGVGIRPVSVTWSESISLSSSSVYLTDYYNKSITLTATVSPSNVSFKGVTWKSSDESVATVSGGKITAVAPGTCTVTATTADGLHSATCAVTVEYFAVDLGLPSGLKWASCNIDFYYLRDPSYRGYGSYFAWGYIYAGTKFTDEEYLLYYNTNRYGEFTSIISNEYGGSKDSRTVLDSDDDAASSIWSNGWRMPSYSEWQELVEGCTWEWTTVDGYNGILLTSKVNSNSIFLPAAGYHPSSEISGEGTCGYYWSRDLYSLMPRFAYNFYFDSSGCTVDVNLETNILLRIYGMSIRPVHP